MRKRSKAGAPEAVASSSGSEAAEEELFAAEQRLGGEHPAAEPAWSDEEDVLSEADEEDSELSGSDREKESGTDADSEASSAIEDSPSDDDELDTAIVELAAGTDAEDAEANPLVATYVFKLTRFPCASHLQPAFFAVVCPVSCLRSQHSQDFLCSSCINQQVSLDGHIQLLSELPCVIADLMGTLLGICK